MNANSARLVAGIGAAAAAAALGLTGCGADTNDIDLPSQQSGEAAVDASGAQVEVGNTINYGSFGTTADVDCGDGKSLNVGGSNNTLTVKGTCATVQVGGAGNKITLDQVTDQVRVVGLNNTITYQNGDPQVDDVGSGNSVKKA
ncbi:DUF3060 domain-containing protein [Mycobacterium sp. WMMD1722]|uniref:DUF3060 domain-containing protein n=1 Tax=Mycobacterium sp. WMMD1722 TaxID=3404117 RepID=UPI003BF576BC